MPDGPIVQVPDARAISQEMGLPYPLASALEELRGTLTGGSAQRVADAYEALRPSPPRTRWRIRITVAGKREELYEVAAHTAHAAVQLCREHAAMRWKVDAESARPRIEQVSRRPGLLGAARQWEDFDYRHRPELVHP